MQQLIAPLAKLDIASVYGTEGQEFESLTVHQKSIIRTLYLLQVSGSDLLFISKSHNKKRSRSSSFCYIKLLSYTKPVLFNIMLLYVKSIPYMILT